MQPLMSVSDVQERYGCCAKTAAKIIRSIDHIEHPRLMCSVLALEKREAAQMRKHKAWQMHNEHVKIGKAIPRRA